MNLVEKKCEEILSKGQTLKKIIKKDAREFCSIGLLCGCLVISAKSIKEYGSEMFKNYEDYKVKKHSLESNTQENKNQKLSDIINSGSIVVFNVNMPLENKYYFQNQYLYNQEEKKVTLESFSDPIGFIYCNLDYQTLSNIRLRESNTKELALTYSSIDNKCIECLPESVEELSLSYCFSLSDLKKLPIQCPNIKSLYLDSLTSVKDYSFLFYFENLEEVSIKDSAYITEDLINYLDGKGIRHNLTEVDVENNRITNAIIDEIITPDMSDKEKIHNICNYVLENVEYDMKQSSDSNARPLRCVLEDGKGVCISYAYLTNVLLEKANINTWLITNESHAWNMVNVDGKYYYIDTTGMDSIEFNKLLFDVFNIGFGYMGDTENVTISSMSKLQSGEVNIPVDLLEDVLSCQDEKDIFEKYGQTVDVSLIFLSIFIKAILICLSPEMIVNIKNKSRNIIQHYKKCENLMDIIDENENKNFYEILGISRTATLLEIII